MYLSRTYCKIILGLGKCRLREMAAEESGRRVWLVEAAEEGTRSISGLGGNSTDMREESKSLRKGLGLVWSETQWIHRFWLLFPLTRASLQVTILPFSSVPFSPNAISSCHHSMLFPTTHPSRRSRPRETSSNPWRRFC